MDFRPLVVGGITIGRSKGAAVFTARKSDKQMRVVRPSVGKQKLARGPKFDYVSDYSLEVLHDSEDISTYITLGECLSATLREPPERAPLLLRMEKQKRRWNQPQGRSRTPLLPRFNMKTLPLFDERLPAS